jgi:hypothetical protein
MLMPLVAWPGILGVVMLASQTIATEIYKVKLN